MRFQHLILAPVLAFNWGSACSEPQVTGASAASTNSGAASSDGSGSSHGEMKRTAARMVKFEEQRTRQLYRDLFDALALNLEQVDRLVNLLTQERLLTSSWTTGEVTHEPQPDDLVRAKAVPADVERMLDSDGFAAFTAYRETLHERFKVRGLAVQLYLAALPLSPEQKERLVTTLAAARDNLLPERTSPQGTLEQAQEITTRHDNYDDYFEWTCHSILSAKQLEIAEIFFADRARRRHDNLERYREQLAAGITSPPFFYHPE
jgi:hypothetical protein